MYTWIIHLLNNVVKDDKQQRDNVVKDDKQQRGNVVEQIMMCAIL